MRWPVACCLAMIVGGWLLLQEPLPVNPVNPVEPIDGDFPSDKKRVLITYEADDKATYPASQSLILDSATFKSWLTDQCDENGWKILDDDTDVGFLDDDWREWMDRPRDGLPWIVFSNGATGSEGPLPQTIEETQQLIEGL